MFMYIYMGFPDGLVGKRSVCNAGDPVSIPGSGRMLGEGNGNPLQYLPWKVPRTEEPGRPYSPWGHKRWTPLSD